MRYVGILLLGVLLLCPMAFAAGEKAAVQDWESVSGGIKALKNETVRKVETLDKQIGKDRQTLQRALNELKQKTAQARERADRLAARLRNLRERESELKRELDKSNAQMRKIESAVRNNVLLFLAGRNVQPALLSRPDWVERLNVMSTPERFPPMADVAFLMDGLLGAIAESDTTMTTTSADVPLLLRDGSQALANIMRVGAFQSVFVRDDDAGYLIANPETNLPQCAPYVTEDEEAQSLRAAMNGSGRLPLDVSGGRILVNPPKKVTMVDRLKSGGMFLWPIVAIGVLGVLLIIERCAVLFRVRLTGKDGNIENGVNSPAARVVKRMREVQEGDAETADRILEEAILDELPPLERFLQTLRVFAAVSPLLGLLGTVSGIIHTFRVITDHGNGDPTLLSGGISEALLTTEMGLIVAVPLLLCHHFLARRKNAIVLDMETAGAAYIARHSTGAA